MAQNIVKWIMHITISFYEKSLVAAGLLKKLLPLTVLKMWSAAVQLFWETMFIHFDIIIFIGYVRDPYE